MDPAISVEQSPEKWVLLQEITKLDNSFICVISERDRIFNKNLNSWSKQDLAKVAKEEFGETPELLASSLQEIKAWIVETPHLHSINQEDKSLTGFLRGCKFNIEKTKKKLDANFAALSSTPEWYDNWDPLDPAMQEILNSGIFLLLPGYDKHGRLVSLVRMAKVIKGW